MSEEMGVQQTADLLTLLRHCEAADEGLIVERRTGALGFDSHTVRENVTTSLTLVYSSGHLDDIAPTDDDQLTANDVTVSRIGGVVSGRVEQSTGPMGTDPTTGAGRYEKSYTLNLYEDDQAYHHAGWKVWLGTQNGYRYPVVSLKLHNSALSALVDTIAAVDISDRITIQGLPSNLPPDDVELMVEGYTERINNFEWTITFNCSPYKPYQVGVLADTSGDTDPDVGRLAGDENAAIRAAIDDNDLSVDFDPNAYRWTTAADDFDPDMKVRLGGEVIEVSAISTTAGTYVAAGAASSADNAAVTPAMYAGAATNDLILVLAAIRNSGTGTLQTPTGYTRLPAFASTANVQLFAKVHDGSEADPTVTPSGGVAGATVTAFTFGLRNMPVSLTDLSDIVAAAADPLLNSSAQNIAYPILDQKVYDGCIVLLLAWKQDDYTSIAVPSGLTEILEASTTTGDDQSLYAAYQIQTTPAVIRDGSLVVTGGAAAISRSVVVALAAGYQTMTISARSVNGVAKSHAAGTKVEVEDALVLAL